MSRATAVPATTPGGEAANLLQERLDPLELMELQALRLEAELLGTQRELLDERKLNLDMRQRQLLQRVAGRRGFLGEVRLDLGKGFISGRRQTEPPVAAGQEAAHE